MWLFVAFVVVVLLKTYVPLLRWKNRPPGPWILPFAGSVLSLSSADPEAASLPFRAMHRLAKKYGPVMSLGLGPDVWVVLTGADEIRQFSMAEEAVGRPDMSTLFKIYSFDKSLGVIFPDGDLWREQRRFMSRTLKELGMGRRAQQDFIAQEWGHFSRHLRELGGDGGGGGRQLVRDAHEAFALPCLNVIWRLVCGRRFDYADPTPSRLIRCLESFTQEGAVGPIASMALLRHIEPFKSVYERMRVDMTEFKAFMSELVREEREAGAAEADDDGGGFVGAFLKAQKEAGDRRGGHFTDEQLVVSVQDFFTGGSGTMSKTLSFALLYLVRNPEWQSRIRREIDSVMEDADAEDEVTASHRPRLPLTEAALMEVQRLGSVLPIAPPRVAQTDMRIGGYRIRRGTQVQMNLYSLHRNESHWGEDAGEFRPERFVRGDHDGGVAVRQDDGLMPFGYGKRKCVGENVARTTAFLFLANMVREFVFEADPDGPVSGPSDVPEAASPSARGRSTSSRRRGTWKGGRRKRSKAAAAATAATEQKKTGF